MKSITTWKTNYIQYGYKTQIYGLQVAIVQQVTLVTLGLYCFARSELYEIFNCKLLHYYVIVLRWSNLDKSFIRRSMHFHIHVKWYLCQEGQQQMPFLHWGKFKEGTEKVRKLCIVSSAI